MTNAAPLHTAASAMGSPTGEGSARPGLGRVVVVTGLSGAGKTLALKALEDLGWEAVDNLPLSLLNGLVTGPEAGIARPLAVGIDIRTRDFGAAPVIEAVERLVAESGREVRLLFLDCDDDVLCRRYTETRRRHPLATDRPLIDGIRHERALLAPLRARADLMIDTTGQAPAAFKRLLTGHFRLDDQHGQVVFVTSFAYRNGLPREADLVFDARFLANPHYRADLRPLTGRDEAVAAYVAADPAFTPFIDSLTRLLEPLLPRFAAEGKSYLTIAVGCTGGRHRSVAVVERLANWLREHGERIAVRHRELDDGGG